MNSIVVFIGSFDPVHKGHLECAQLALQKCPHAKKVVFLPNNSRRGKPNRSQLLLRARWLSFSMPIYNHSDWIFSTEKIVCDTRDCDYVVDILRDQGLFIIGIVGSDLCKPPKLIAQDWIVVERNGFSVKDSHQHLEGKQIITVPLVETKWQHLSSSFIRESARLSDNYAKDAIDQNLIPYFEKKFLGESLSLMTIKHGFSHVNNVETFRICYVDSGIAQICVENLEKLAKSTIVNFFRLPKVVQHCENVLHFSRIGGMTMFDVLVRYINESMSEKEVEDILTMAFKLLQQIYFSKKITFPEHFHCDPSAKNIIFERPLIFSMVDFENCKTFPDKSQCQKYYDRFASSFEFYLMLHGYERDQCIINLIRDCEKKAWQQNINLIDAPV